MARDIEPLRQFFRGCRDAANFLDLRVASANYFEATHVVMASYIHYPPVGAHDFDGQIRVGEFGYPEAWRETYLAEKLHLCDPLARRAVNFTRPYFWTEASQLPNLTPEERHYLQRATAQNMGEGIGIPLFGPAGRNGYAALGFGQSERPPADEVLELQAAAQMGHLAYCRLLLKDLPNGTNLSAREREILRWVARGRTNSQIAEVLDLSRNTVETYIRRCFEKLDVNDRVSAALRGIALGMVD
ncbi:autoinducer binding domain-containing protein [Hyphomonas sp.]|uniref:helix-turn-helix transcriptional regulator n=1 Tax=Hyphomonas sp. TaxID=87 RepID=UPI003528D76C